MDSRRGDGAYIAIIVVLAIIVFVVALPFISEWRLTRDGSEPLSRGDLEWRTYSSDRFGFSFRYPSKYFLEERQIDGTTSYYLIMLTEDTEENRLVREGKAPGRDGPIAITIEVHPNELGKLSATAWAETKPESNFKLSNGKYVFRTIAGRDAVAYSWSGLYEADNIVIAKNGYMFSLAATYLTREDKIRKDFEGVLDTLRFN